MGSPFSMGLNGLVLRNATAYVEKFRVRGEWKDNDLQEYSSVGRVTEGSMMLNTMIRVAVEKMPLLDSFRYGRVTFNKGIKSKGHIADLLLAGSWIRRCCLLCGEVSQISPP